MIFILIILLLWRGLTLHPNLVPSPFINQPTPAFRLPTLFHPPHSMTQKDLKGQVTLFHIWSTTCVACAEEHPFLLELSQNHSIVINSLNYKDSPQAAKIWLKKYGNPYHLIAIDQTGETGIDWGVYGTPETFVIDKKGIIRYKQIGPITPDNWEHILQPLIKKLQATAS
jgi:cytochrome c biogenesis protein CcmG/thiol:disulfide interchange protein DsbE